MTEQLGQLKAPGWPCLRGLVPCDFVYVRITVGVVAAGRYINAVREAGLPVPAMLPPDEPLGVVPCHLTASLRGMNPPRGKQNPHLVASLATPVRSHHQRRTPSQILRFGYVPESRRMLPPRKPHRYALTCSVRRARRI